MRLRLTLRRAMLLVAAAALGLFIWAETRDGMPPRSVVRGIPARVARLKPGMSYAEAKEILGLDRSWLRGGTNAWLNYGEVYARSILYVFTVRPELTSSRPDREAPRIQLKFDMDTVGPKGWRRPKSTRLTSARFLEDGEVSAYMPR